jgi:hypothetical protein
LPAIGSHKSGPTNARKAPTPAVDYAAELERATQGLLARNVVEQMSSVDRERLLSGAMSFTAAYSRLAKRHAVRESDVGLRVSPARNGGSNPGLLTRRIGNSSFSRLESGFPAITEPPRDHDYLRHGYAHLPVFAHEARRRTVHMPGVRGTE